MFNRTVTLRDTWARIAGHGEHARRSAAAAEKEAQAEREKKHHSKFEYSLGEFRLGSAEIRQRLAEFYDDYQWGPPVEENKNGG